MAESQGKESDDRSTDKKREPVAQELPDHDIQNLSNNELKCEESKTEMSDLEKDLDKLAITPSSSSVQDVIPDDSKCPICHDERLHSITLPCGHSFCYLCIKGVYARQRVCALCRQSIPSNAINQPSSVNQEEVERERSGIIVQWYYQAKSGGWWMYEERISRELEKAYQSSNTTRCNIQISGFLYTIDFERMIQYRQEKPDRIRQIKRSTEEEGGMVRGVAGIPLTVAEEQQ